MQLDRRGSKVQPAKLYAPTTTPPSSPPVMRNVRLPNESLGIDARLDASERSEGSQVRTPSSCRRNSGTSSKSPASFRGLRRSKWGSSAVEDFRKSDLLNFRASVRRRVRTQELARTSFSVRMLLLLEERTDHWAAGRVQIAVTVLVFASVVLLALHSVGARNAGWSYADLSCAVTLLVEWLARCCLHVAMQCTAGGELGALASRSHLPWLIVDGLASISHSGTAAVAAFWPAGDGKVTAVSVLAGLRLFRLLSIVRYSATLDLLAAVMSQAANALKGPMYLLAVSAIFVGTAIYYAEQLGASTTTDFDTMLDALFFSWVTFSTVGYGDQTPVTAMGRLITMVGIAMGMLWFAMPISIVGSTFEVEWHRRNVRRVSDALQTELLERGEMTNGLYRKFVEIDTDGSNTLDEEEFVRFLKSHGRLKTLGPTESRAMFGMMDPDHGGTITYKELVRVVFPGIDVTTHMKWHACESAMSQSSDSTWSGQNQGSGPRSVRVLARPKSLSREILSLKKQGAITSPNMEPKVDGVEDFEASINGMELSEAMSESYQAEGPGDGERVGLQAQVRRLQAGQEQMLARLEALSTAVDRLASRD